MSAGFSDVIGAVGEIIATAISVDGDKTDPSLCTFEAAIVRKISLSALEVPRGGGGGVEVKCTVNLGHNSHRYAFSIYLF